MEKEIEENHEEGWRVEKGVIVILRFKDFEGFP